MPATVTADAGVLRRAEATRSLLLFGAGCLAAAPAAGLLWLARPLVALAWCVALAAIVVLTRRPAIGFYLLIGAALLIDQYRLADLQRYTGIRLPTSMVPFWQTFAGVTAADAVLVGSLLLLILRRLHAGAAPLRAGPLLLPVLLLTLAVLAGVWHGMAQAELLSPAPFSAAAAVAEVRAFLYLPLMYLLAMTVLDSPGKFRALLWVVIAATALKSGQTLWVIVRIGAEVFTINEVATHEDSIYAGAFVVLALAAAIYRLPGVERRAALALVPLSVVALVANHRRIAFIALGAALVVTMTMAVADRGFRPRTLLVTLSIVVGAALYTALLWHSAPAEQPLAWPVYAVRSVTDPRTTRDVNSNLFRQMENINLARTAGLEPWLGTGFGRQYLRWIEQPLLDASFTYWRYIGHNSIYWVWVKVGAIGFVLFWYLVGGALALAAASFRRLSDPLLKVVALAACCSIVMQMLYAYADLGLTSARNMVLLGGWIGVAGAVSRVASPKAVA